MCIRVYFIDVVRFYTHIETISLKQSSFRIFYALYGKNQITSLHYLNIQRLIIYCSNDNRNAHATQQYSHYKIIHMYIYYIHYIYANVNIKTTTICMCVCV